MGARLSNPPFTNEMNTVTSLDTAKTVCDGDGRPSLSRAVYCVLNYMFAITVKGRGRFVKQENSRIA